MPPPPLIGITRPNRGDRLSYFCAWVSLRLCGARAVALSAAAPGESLPLDGLVLTGGRDVHPTLFQGAPKADYAYDAEREAMELAWLRRAWRRDLPTLGICRGAQLMNVAVGGALHMDVARAFAGARYPGHWFEQLYFRKAITIEPGSLLAAISGGTDLWVNSIHSQAVNRLGEGLTVTAREPNGVVQAVEDPSRRFWLGVQFHPEFLYYRDRCRRIFHALVAAAARHAADRAADRPPSPGKVARAEGA